MDSDPNRFQALSSGEVSHFYILGDWDQDYLEENVKLWLEEAKQNRSTFYQELCTDSTSLPFLAVFNSVVETVFRIGDQMAFTPDVQFLTIDLFDRFCMRQFSIHLDTIKEHGPYNVEMWEVFKTKVCDQYLLRILSCMQLASKYLYALNEPLTHNIIKDWLDKANHDFSKADIKQSEIRVLETLNFRIGGGNNVLFYVECLLYVAVNKDLMDGGSLYTTAVQVLSMAYLKRQEIYHKLFNAMTKTWERNVEQRIKFLPMECDSLLLAAGTVLTSVAILTQNEAVINTTSTTLANYIELSSRDIRHLFKIIFHIIIS